MNKSTLAAFAITVVLTASPLSHQAQAGTGIQRCEAPDGSSVYTDKGCAAFDAPSLPISGELMTKVMREEAREHSLADAQVLPAGIAAESNVAGLADASMPLEPRTAAIGRRSASAGCARTPTQLAMDLQGAFALGDVNRIAESYHWVGISHKGGMRIMERLEALSRRSIIDTQYFDAQISSGSSLLAGSDTSSIGGSGGVMQVSFGNRSTTTAVADFDVERHAGCYFIRF